MRIAISADHRGWELGGEIASMLGEGGHEVIDLRPAAPDADDDYPDRARAVGEAVRGGSADRGIVVCGSGVGACIAANKMHGVRASVSTDTYSARQGVEHDDMNVLCLGSLITGPAAAREIVRAFLQGRFSGEERHLRRLKKVGAMERDG